MSDAVSSAFAGAAGGGGAGVVAPPGVHSAAATEGFHSFAFGLKLISSCC